jgi:hypothetical protein
LSEAFRKEVVDFLGPYRELNGFHFQGSRWEQVRAFFRALGARGWLSIGWDKSVEPKALGPEHEYVLWDECAYRRVARPPLSAGIVAKTIIAHGTPEQRERWLGPIRRGDIFFSLGYSETEAGSDLAGLKTRAERRGDRYVVSGGKCWTSYAQHSDYLWTLCRTAAPESRSKGLSLLILDLKAPGVTVRPIPLLDGEQLNQVTLEDVEVPLENRIGPENGAWPLVNQALAVERHVQFPPKRLRRDLEDLVAWSKKSGRAADPIVRERLLDLAVSVAEVEVLGHQVLETVLRGQTGTLEAAYSKLAHTEVAQKLARTAVDIGGPEALLAGSMFELLWRQSTWETVGGGTSEIMRSVIARERFGLSGRA